MTQTIAFRDVTVKFFDMGLTKCERTITEAFLMHVPQQNINNGSAMLINADRK